MSPTELLKRARQATNELRDAARTGRVIEFRQRDPLVLAIHAVLDAYEALVAAEGQGHAATPTDWPARGDCTCEWVRYEEMSQRDPTCPRHKDAPDPPAALDREALVKALLEAVEDFRRIDAIYEKDRVAHVYGHQIEKILDKWLHDDETTPDVLARLRAPTPTGETR